MRQLRELDRQEKELSKLDALRSAANEVAQFERYLQALVSTHKDCGPLWMWGALATATPPPAPVRRNGREMAAMAAAQAYNPGFFDRMLGGAQQKALALQQDLERARLEDQREYDEALIQHRAVCGVWDHRRQLAAGILARDPNAYRAALQHASPFGELEAIGIRVAVAEAEQDAVALRCEIVNDECVPSEELKLTASGKKSSKAMASGRYWTLYQDWVCSSAIRAAREALAVLPIPRVVVNAGRVQANTMTGHPASVTFLAVQFLRATLDRLNLDAIDPSDSMRNFPFRMKLRKTEGFEPVMAMTLDERWVSTE